MIGSTEAQRDRPVDGVVERLARTDLERKKFLKMAARRMGGGAAAASLAAFIAGCGSSSSSSGPRLRCAGAVREPPPRTAPSRPR
jgi:hypothetical protein